MMSTEDKKDDDSHLSRRDFLGLLGGAACMGAMMATGAAMGSAENAARQSKRGFQQNDTQYAESVSNPPSIPGYNWNDHQWAMAVDTTRCIGCLRCMEACKIENSVQLDANHHRTWVERYVYLEGADQSIVDRATVDTQTDPKNIENAGSETRFRFDDRYRDAKVQNAFFVPKLCNQCEHPSCVQVCPTGATFKSKDGPVLIDTTYCIGCQYCVQACPYGARSFNQVRGTAEKCNWCYHRITKGLNPACVEVCPTGTRMFGDLNDPQSTVSQFIRNNHVQVLKPEMGNAPNVYYKGLDKEVV
jgi:tetrathionate reductase subunit B